MISSNQQINVQRQSKTLQISKHLGFQGIKMHDQ